MPLASPFVSLLDPLINNKVVFSSIKAASMRYAATLYEQQTGVLTTQSGYGIARHADFNMVLTNTLTLVGRRSGVRFIAKKKEDNSVIGDVVVYTPYKGQARFNARLREKKFELIHMTATPHEDALKLELYGMGVTRKEFCKNQSSRVKRLPVPTLFNESPETFEMVVDDGNPTRVIVVTQVTGNLKDKLIVWACLPTPEFNADDGWIQLADLKKLFEIPISGGPSNIRVTPKPQDLDHGIKVTKKQKPS